MNGGQTFLAVWAFGALWTWPWFAVALYRSDGSMGAGGGKLSALNAVELGYLIWFSLAACVLAWPVMLSSLVIHRVLRRVAR